MSGLAPWLNLVRFSHSIFALPFALCGAWLAAGGPPPLFDLLLIVLCAVSARTAAMGFNRLVDRHIDRRNRRTAARELPAGVLTPLAVGALVLFSSALFFLGAFALNPLAGYLATPVLAVLLGYSLVKRFHWCAHGVLGLALALAPLGAWVAVRGAVDGDAWPVLTLALAVWTWVAGFDLIYACQDADFDRGAGLHSIPGRFGVAAALSASAALHVVTVVALLGTAFLAGLGLPFLVALALASALLVWEHRLVRPDDLSRVDAAFFT
ncbi:MAG: UbiA-like polyprenyltransferase, partial [Planctomycetota bacterium]|nr:UbiA-like polyprenyltransferase [Planctomycetota bacterium]